MTGPARGLSRVGLAILDQAFFAGTTALVMVFAARILSADQYGQLAAVYAAAVLLQAAQAALLTEPAIVLVSGEYKAFALPYLLWLDGWSSRVSFALVALFGCTGALIGLWLRSDSPLLLGVATIALVPWVSFSQWRRVAYACGRSAKSVVAAAMQCALAVIGVGGMSAVGLHQPWIVLVGLGVASLIPSVWLRRVVLRYEAAGDTAAFSSELARGRHLRYAKWGVPAALARWVPDNAVYLLLPILLGVAEAGAVRSSQNLTLPFRHLVVALGLLVLPRLSSHALAFGRRSALLLAVRFGVALAALNGVVLIAFVIWGDRIVGLVYPGADSVLSSMMIAGAGVTVLASVHAMLSTFQRAVEQPRAVLLTTLGNGIVTLGVSPTLVDRFGALGAVYAMVVGAAFATVIAAYMATRLSRAVPEPSAN